MTKTRKAEAIAHPSLALIKYWGKADTELNLPAVPSLALTLGDLTTHTVVEYRRTASRDRVFIHGAEQAPERFNAFFRTLRKTAQNHGAEDVSGAFTVRSQSNFPTAAGSGKLGQRFCGSDGGRFCRIGCGGSEGAAVRNSQNRLGVRRPFHLGRIRPPGCRGRPCPAGS